ncbi:hypothetical protein MXD62_16650 [Frankia sp. Mgl5]|uniref:hypothetical protein n=1 Tax=Frankia sp. Mgl5 TaxID=2933793 RepID=UPI00200FFB28|nr:hypothetical protein [Frankia sp. Mgl5]MCK9928786.1 hypothetical protein [Frankia sp. Mgl5]
MIRIRLLVRALGRRPCHRATCGHPVADHRHDHDRTYCARCDCLAYHRRIGGRRR